ncbi:Autophagy-related protein 7 (Atg7) [Monocercomonoides exilis]|uniref:Autophagy-related protein 7 (Atg7) n=1 Tax=Monocercomonoides exilis TaxID=2049356 RepID=UPI00355AA353|nr:Autophagy-related protein 7 (Atg7) [Monocercomonoides exilis]|eukprot:MONOS_5372.1-p1 / transcript=MONOS_5372.1 / gene=MONOS_5372 / organism=Monocercomonoides_exilis_PA203 / gene_product=Autophagy-related protein 7 (Atg7) / transcript_product=Autophagy-related protein 7 (Atg7) / location=Mono_scaffold00155:69650-72217(+) / protein_length=774 / sequence_SO=supercontig / SO=protein_coding / is_pseudo=false
MSDKLLFQPFTSSPDILFWKVLSEKKLDVLKLSDDAVGIVGHFCSGTEFERAHSLFFLDENAFEASKAPPEHHYAVPGSLINTNTKDAFLKLNFKQILEDAGKKILKGIASKEILEHPEELSRFTLCSFADLKEYSYMYWFAFPVLNHPLLKMTSKFESISNFYKEDEIEKLLNQVNGISSCYDPSTLEIFPISSLPMLIESVKKGERKTIGIAVKDPGSSNAYPGWNSRNYLYALSYYGWESGLKEVPVEIAFIRECDPRKATNITAVASSSATPSSESDESAKNSPTFLVRGVIPALESDPCAEGAAIQCIGWEKNQHGKFKARMVNLREQFDSRSIADTSVDLNLKLMRWRLVESLDLEALKETRCLLLGSGTLGCYVGRALAAWGVRHITFVDRGKVSFSNPVRQPLFQFEHCLGGGQPKAETAAEEMKKILPTIDTKGISMTIHMPGHPVQPGKEEEECRRDVLQLERLIRSHDVVFMLTDSREARWLPTLLCSYYGKVAINSALGFDTLVTMRHGHVRGAERITVSPLEKEEEGAQKCTVNPERLHRKRRPHLGCYFCSDVVAPRNSLRERTLDQQCTVTRPGMAPIASAVSVEMMVCLLHSRKKNMAEAGDAQEDEDEIAKKLEELKISKESDEAKKEGEDEELVGDEDIIAEEDKEELKRKEILKAADQDEDEGTMKFVPHQFRMFMNKFQTGLYHFSSFEMCTACSSKVRAEYAKRGFDFLLQAFNDPEYLERLVGISQMMNDDVQDDDEDSVREVNDDGFEIV